MGSEIEVQDDVARIVGVGSQSGGSLLKPHHADSVADDAFEVADQLVLLHVPSGHGDGVAGDCGLGGVGVCVGWRERDGIEVLALEGDCLAGPVLGELLDDRRRESRVGRLTEVEGQAIEGVVAAEPHPA